MSSIPAARHRPRSRSSGSRSQSRSMLGPRKAPTGLGEHLLALVEPDHRAARPPDELGRDRAGPGGDVEYPSLRADRHPGDEEPAPPRILTEREQRGVAVIRRPERREQGLGVL